MTTRDDTITGLRRRISDLEDTVAELVEPAAEVAVPETTTIVETFAGGVE